MNVLLVLILLLTTSAGAQDKSETVRRLIAQLKSDLATSADPASLYTRLGLLYVRMDEADSAQSAFEKSLQLKPEFAVALTGLGRIELEIRNRPNEALPYFESAAKLDTTDARTQDLLMATYIKLAHTGRTARNAADRATILFPDLAAPYLLRAKIHENDNSHDAAIYYYKKYLERQPEDQDAALGFALVLYASQRYRDLKEITSRMNDKRALPLLAQALIWHRDHEGALAAFQHYIATLSKEEQALYNDISLVGTQQEIGAYRLAALSDNREQLDRFLDRFWLQKDPFKTSGGAMRRAEHYRRIWHARNLYGKKWPWDKRGDVYIRWGEPDFRSKSSELNARVPLDIQLIQEGMAHQLYGNEGLDATYVGPVFPVKTQGMGSFSGSSSGDLGFSSYKPVTAGSNWSSVPWEVWIYKNLGNGIEITFTDEFLSGNFDYAPMPALTDEDFRKYDNEDHSYMQVIQRLNEYAPASLVQSVAATDPEHYSMDALEPLDFYFDTLTFRGQDGLTDLQINVALPIDNLAMASDPDTTVVVERRTALVYPRALDYQKTKMALSIPVNDGNRDRGLHAISRVDHSAPPGEYELAIEAARENSNKVGAYQLPQLKLPDYAQTEHLLISDLQLASRIVEAAKGPDSSFIRGNYYIQPQPSATFVPGSSPSLFLYFEIYNLTRDAFGQTRYDIAYEVQQRDEKSFAMVPLLGNLGGTKKAESVGLSFEQGGTDLEEKTYLELPLTHLKPSRYTLQITVSDKNANKTVSKSATFYIPKPR
jgi:GWxTD domain-containing protein